MREILQMPENNFPLRVSIYKSQSHCFLSSKTIIFLFSMIFSCMLLSQTLYGHRESLETAGNCNHVLLITPVPISSCYFFRHLQPGLKQTTDNIVHCLASSFSAVLFLSAVAVALFSLTSQPLRLFMIYR